LKTFFISVATLAVLSPLQGQECAHPLSHAHFHSHSHGHEAGDHSGCDHGPHRKPPGWFNPEIELALDLVGSWSERANQRNFTLRDGELILRSDLGRHAQVYGSFNAGTELEPVEDNRPFNLTRPAVEELALVFDRLPWGLELKAGQFFADFSRIGKLHGHELPFVDRPFSSEAILGGETKARGLELSWKPRAARQLRFTAGLVNQIGAEAPITAELETDFGEGETFARRSNGPLRSVTGYGRAAADWRPSRSTTLELGANYAQGSEFGTRRVASTDLHFTWVPHPEKEDLFEAGSEALWTRQNGQLSPELRAAGAPDSGSATASGGYVYAQYRFGERWQPGVRLDYLRSNTWAIEENAADKSRNQTWITSAYLTCRINAANRLRFQVNHLDARDEIVPGKSDRDWQFFVQWTVLWGM